MTKESYMFKSCFYPWNRSDIAFDSILSLSLSCRSCAVYLTKYIKTKGSIELLFTDDTYNTVASLKTKLLDGVNSYQLIGENGELVGVTMLIDTPLYETYIEQANVATEDRLRVSPICFADIDVDIVSNTININGVNTRLNAQEIILDDSLGAMLLNNTLTIKPVIDITNIRNNSSEIAYVTSIGTSLSHIADDGGIYTEYHVYLPEAVTVESVVDADSATKDFNSIVTLSVSSHRAQCYSNTDLVPYAPDPPTESNKTIYPFTACFSFDTENNVYRFDLDKVEDHVAEQFKLASSKDWDKLRPEYDK